jgi:hypothetical protein
MLAKQFKRADANGIVATGRLRPGMHLLKFSDDPVACQLRPISATILRFLSNLGNPLLDTRVSYDSVGPICKRFRRDSIRRAEITGVHVGFDAVSLTSIGLRVGFLLARE